MKVDVKEYIASGMLEAYILGSATEQERAEVESVAAMYPEVRAELDSIEAAMNEYAQRHSIRPSDELKEKIINEITGESKSETILRKISMAEEERRDPRNKMVWSIAASVMLMISLTLNIYLYTQRTEKAENYVHELTSKNHVKDSILGVLTVQYKQAQEDMAILKDPMYKIVELKGKSADTAAKAMVCWCPGSKLVYFEADKMPALPKGKQYQLWAMVDGKPVSEGMITMSNGLHKMKDIGTATAFAVTIEQEGGSDTPHGDMVVEGSI